MSRAPIRRSSVTPLPGGPGEARLDELAVEEPLELRIDGETLATTMRTPGADERLALGLLFTEGLIAGPEDVGTIAPCGRPGEPGYGNVIDVRPAGGARIVPERVLQSRRHLPGSSACGVCGRASIDELVQRCVRLPEGAQLPASLVLRAMQALHERQPIFRATGGTHAIVAVDRAGLQLASFEDVGRHNACDKVIGELLLRGALGQAAVLAVSGRASFEIVQKAAVARIPIVASVSAPTSLAVELAERLGLTLVGFVRDGRGNVYANPGRLSGP